jgi:hypothetical protein
MSTNALNEIMAFDHVIQVHPDGTVTDAPDDVHAPELDAENDTVSGDGWTLLRGFTGQYGYNGPIMHSSEFIGGGLARHILETPGYYVALVAEYWSDGNCWNDENGNPLGEPYVEGWAVAYHAAPDGEDARLVRDEWHYGNERGVSISRCRTAPNVA